MSLELLIDNPEKVLTSWPTEPVLSHRAPTQVASLLTLQELDDWIDHDCLAMRNIALLKDGGPVDKRLYADGDMPRRGYVRKHLNDGGTLSVRSLERLQPAIAALYRELQGELGYGIHVNAYLTPAGCQGLRYHYDHYVTAILQAHGRKAWPLHLPFVEDPMKEWGSFHEWRFTEDQLHFLANTPPVVEYVLEPGDAFWLPRGYVHSPYTVGNEPSLHLTVALKERTRHWVLNQIIEQILGDVLPDPALRSAVPPSVLLGDPRDCVDLMRRFLVGAAANLDVDEVSRRLQVTVRRPVG